MKGGFEERKMAGQRSPKKAGKGQQRRKISSNNSRKRGKKREGHTQLEKSLFTTPGREMV